VLDSSRMLLRLVGHRLAEMEMDNLLTKAVAWLALAFAAVSVAAWCYAIVRAMFTSGSGATRTRRQSSDDDSVQWYDQSRP
jgi:hypothetical protein